MNFFPIICYFDIWGCNEWFEIKQGKYWPKHQAEKVNSLYFTPVMYFDDRSDGVDFGLKTKQYQCKINKQYWNS